MDGVNGTSVIDLVALSLFTNQNKNAEIELAAKVDRNNNSNSVRDQFNDIQRTSDFHSLIAKMDAQNLAACQLATLQAAQLAECCCNLKVLDCQIKSDIAATNNKIDTQTAIIVGAIDKTTLETRLKEVETELLLAKMHHHVK